MAIIITCIVVLFAFALALSIAYNYRGKLVCYVKKHHEIAYNEQSVMRILEGRPGTVIELFHREMMLLNNDYASDSDIANVQTRYRIALYASAFFAILFIVTSVSTVFISR